MRGLSIFLLVLLGVVALGEVSKEPRIENWQVWTRKDGCQFASFAIQGGTPGDYYLMWSSPEFIVPNMWLPINRLTNFGTITTYTNVPLLTNFSVSNFRLESAPPKNCP